MPLLGLLELLNTCCGGLTIWVIISSFYYTIKTHILTTTVTNDGDTYAVCLSHCQLVGGTTRTLSDGMKIRGDINICLMGDPGWYNSTTIIQRDAFGCRVGYVPGSVWFIF